MKKCLDCGTEIAPQYERCMACNNKAKAQQGAPTNEGENETIRALGAINQNLYALRTIAEFRLKKEQESVLVWVKGTSEQKKGRFEIKKE